MNQPGVYMCSPSWTPSHLPSQPIPWIIPEHQFWVPCFMHQNWTGDLFHIWQYTCFNAILTLLSDRTTAKADRYWQLGARMAARSSERLTYGWWRLAPLTLKCWELAVQLNKTLAYPGQDGKAGMGPKHLWCVQGPEQDRPWKKSRCGGQWKPGREQNGLRWRLRKRFRDWQGLSCDCSWEMGRQDTPGKEIKQEKHRPYLNNRQACNLYWGRQRKLVCLTFLFQVSIFIQILFPSCLVFAFH